MKEKKRTIKTEIPGSLSLRWEEERRENIPRAIKSQAPFYIQEGKGALLKDLDGNVFLDFSSGIGVNNLGHCHQEVVEAVQEQSQKYLHTCSVVVMYPSYVKLAAKLNQLAPGENPKKTFFLNSGAEAVENAVKIARRYTGKPGLASLEHSFHGRTLLTMSLTSKVKPFKFGFGPFAPEIYHLPAPYCYRCHFGLEYPGCSLACAEYLENFFLMECPAESLAAVVLEPVLGEGGFIVPPLEYFTKIRELCDRYGVLIIMDEIQTGFGRTGKLFASEHSGIEPDLIAVAKSMGGGLPVSGVIGKAEIMDAPGPGELGSTFGGNPVTCQSALKVLEVLDKEGLPDRAQFIGRTVKNRLEEMKEKYSLIGDIRGLGAMVALELVKDRDTREPASEATAAIIQECYQKGLVVLKAGAFNHIIRMLIPLVITEEQLQEGLDILESAVEKVQREWSRE